jgi:Copper chaperone PCu(A)C
MRVSTVLAGALLVVMSGAVVACGDRDVPSSGVRAGDPEFLGVYLVETPPSPTGATADSQPDAPLFLCLVSPIDDAIVGVEVAPEVALKAELRGPVAPVDAAGAADPSASGDTAAPCARSFSGAVDTTSIGRVDVPAGEPVVLAEGGDHVRLVGLVEPLHRNDIVELDIEFEHAGTRHLRVVVRDARALADEAVSG